MLDGREIADSDLLESYLTDEAKWEDVPEIHPKDRVYYRRVNGITNTLSNRTKYLLDRAAQSNLNVFYYLAVSCERQLKLARKIFEGAVCQK